MRYVGQDKGKLYLKCRHCDKIYAYEKDSFIKRNHRKCSDCGKGRLFIWFYPVKIPRILKMLTALPCLIMVGLSLAIIFITHFPLFQQSYYFNKAITSLNPIMTSLLISALCSFLSFLSPELFKNKSSDGSENIKRSSIIAVLIGGVLLIFAINIIMQTEYCSLEITNPSTGEIQQYFGNATGEYASGKGRLFNSQGELVYIGEFKDNLFDGYGKQFELINTVHNTDNAQSYRCVYEGYYKDGMPHGEGREYRYDAEYTFEKDEDMDPNLYYEGTFVENEYCGYGTLYNLDSKSEGVFFDGVLNGYAKRWYLDSSDKKTNKLEGSYVDGSLNGAGKKYYPDGTILFDGDYKNGRSVRGISYFSDGNIRYTGEWDGNEYEGNGKLYWKSGSIRYDGDWLDDKRTGSGTSYREDGTIEYIGGWSENNYSGYGKLYYEDGTTLQYDGRYNDGVQSGNGNEYYRDGTLRYSGNWASGNWNGQGVWFWENGKPYYEGSFVDGAFHGFGSTYSEDGTPSYEGNFKNGLRNGQGTSYIGAAIKDYEGEFSDDQRSGQGTSYWPNGNVQYTGGWYENLYSGEGQEFDEEGTLLQEGIFSNGEFISSSSDS